MEFGSIESVTWGAPNAACLEGPVVPVLQADTRQRANPARANGIHSGRRVLSRTPPRWATVAIRGVFMGVPHRTASALTAVESVQRCATKITWPQALSHCVVRDPRIGGGAEWLPSGHLLHARQRLSRATQSQGVPYTIQSRLEIQHPTVTRTRRLVAFSTRRRCLAEPQDPTALVADPTTISPVVSPVTAFCSTTWIMLTLMPLVVTPLPVGVCSLSMT